ncbi:MAG: hypothetical protein JEZ07_07840 [Phycisphaerae bacterium]|nr:hypothetical protein [Phycisphaerae bacterium]
MAEFAGDKKVGQSILGPAETKFKNACVPHIPKCIETYHLTLTTILWSAGTVIFGWLAKENIAWIWGISAMILLQYITDLFDGAVGRYRDTGLVKWGFFMDHFLDFIFSCSLVVAYAMMAPDGMTYYFFGLIICSGAFMVNSFLNFASTNEFEIFFYGIGPTEVRVGYIAMNTIIFFLDTGIFKIWVPVLLIINVIALTFMIWKSQWKLWQIDMEAKKEKDSKAT